MSFRGSSCCVWSDRMGQSWAAQTKKRARVRAADSVNLRPTMVDSDMQGSAAKEECIHSRGEICRFFY